MWSRGEGWVLAGLARVLEVMPADFPSRPRYVKLYQDMAARLIQLQAEDGLWRSSLLDPDAFPEAETSGTALETYGLAFGINHGLLDRQTYLPHVLKAWAGSQPLHPCPDGLLGQVQTTGDQPVPTRPEYTGMYASGPFIMAGLEIADLGDAPAPLPVAVLPYASCRADDGAANESRTRRQYTPALLNSPKPSARSGSGGGDQGSGLRSGHRHDQVL